MTSRDAVKEPTIEYSDSTLTAPVENKAYGDPRVYGENPNPDHNVTSFGRDTHVNQSAIVGGGGNHSASGGLSSQGLSGSGVPGAQGTGPDNTADRSGGLSHRQDAHSGVASGLGAGAGATGLAGHHSARGATTGAGVPSSQAYLGGTGEIGHIGSGYTQTLNSGAAGATNTGPTSGQGHGRSVGNTSSEHDVGAGLGSGAGPRGAGVGSTTGSHGVAPTGTGVTTNHEYGTNPSATSGHSVAGAPLVAGAGLAGAGLASGAALDSSHSKQGEHGEHDHTHGELLANHESATGKNKARRPIIEEDKKGKYSDAAPGVPIGGIAYPDEIPQGGIRSDYDKVGNRIGPGHPDGHTYAEENHSSKTGIVDKIKGKLGMASGPEHSQHDGADKLAAEETRKHTGPGL